jgi:squalene synthase HpnC
MSAATSAAPSPLAADASLMAQAGTENFPVAPLLLGRYRRHLRALYRFARCVDDIGDEADGDRLALLELMSEDLSRLYAGQTPRYPVTRTLRRTVRECRLPEEPFRRLLQANRQDQLVHRYQTFEALLDYCQLSAAPIGELVLHVFGAATPARIELSDRVCWALQVIEHLQDVGEDYSRGRTYLPQDDLARARCDERELAAPTASPRLRHVVARLARRCGALLEAGISLRRELPPRAAFAVSGFIAGGHATLAALERGGYDVLAQQRQRTRRDFAVALWEVVRR